ncbi:NUDIX hydrolase [Sinomicrobium soli]|uniref:NUDIX hydrolase n=1 Tax=Sinomicrobium sp. N-1-3-6 TaxID=2219864 RepID=UPI00293727FE|nr:NUDIX domain-containing protein [Sinomicrobium sp. N-1-3-6]
MTNIITKELKHKLFLLESVDLEEVIRQLNKGEIPAAHLYHPDAGQLFEKFCRKIPVVVAAGGLVSNPAGEVLFIFRNGKWDLPKGKLEKKESVEEAAIREVEEETGIRKLKLGPLLNKTYHIFRRNGEYRLKETYWFSMSSTFTGKFRPQCEEGIEKVEWKKVSEIPLVLGNSYANIRTLFAN